MSRLRIHAIPASRALRSLLGADFTVVDLNLAALSSLAPQLDLWATPRLREWRSCGS
jgi:hypothetical protein